MKTRTAIMALVLAISSLLFFQQGHSQSKHEVVKTEKKVKLGFIGVGLRGLNHLRNAAMREDVIITAICDIDPVALKNAQDTLKKYGDKPAKEYTGSDYAYRNLLKDSDVEAVIISSPWLWHTTMAVDAMKAGKRVGLEVSAALTIEECWDLVNTYESTGVHCMLLENVCYRRDVLAVLNMVREGLFGELIHARCGYQHDLRGVKFNDGMQPYGGGVEFGEKGINEARWRTNHSIKQDGDVYPTHGLGPIAEMFEINRGNRFVSISSHATKARGLHDYIVNHPKGGPNHPNASIVWKQGDIITTTLTTARDETIIITHDCNLPRPYSLGFRLDGTKGLTEFDMYNQRIYIEGKAKEYDKWDDMKPWFEKYDHPMWKKYGEIAADAGHGGMDFFLMKAFVESVKDNSYPPLDVYDCATWSAITPLSEVSILNNGAPQAFPDFTRGKWMINKPIFEVNKTEY